ncbi:hypothetical protein Pst134EA_009442 [Puccinia striiformis f. sp. tritici]|uniref:hypothetical protein n=1 Tax=Puccinia striiformis f. sp. tritici TaxID=168172 RepID=UPI0020072038|nr:hypothetical protein Pst134EA_009442 [Puccinia striiformis f. sp. tritici]KAH9468914.1 hypothetical protein Pst134EA_009442 [Puccinia striiformis f. sp. tritici]
MYAFRFRPHCSHPSIGGVQIPTSILTCREASTSQSFHSETIASFLQLSSIKPQPDITHDSCTLSVHHSTLCGTYHRLSGISARLSRLRPDPPAPSTPATPRMTHLLEMLGRSTHHSTHGLNHSEPKEMFLR